MDRVGRSILKEQKCEGRIVREAFGKGACVEDADTSMGYMTVSPEAAGKTWTGERTETYLVVRSEGAYVEYDGVKEPLEKDDVLLVAKGDTYSYAFDSEDSCLELVYFIPSRRSAG